METQEFATKSLGRPVRRQRGTSEASEASDSAAWLEICFESASFAVRVCFLCAPVHHS